MGLFDFLKKEGKLDKDVEKIFHKIHRELTARQIVDHAISLRNLKQYDKSIQLLQDAIKKYHYLPAKTILGTTLLMKGDIDAAEAHFKKMLSEHIQGDDYPLIEIYANLGSLYHNHKEDFETALKYYKLAIEAPKPKTINDKVYEFMVSNVYRDLCIICFKLQEFQSAKQFALKRLQVVKDCSTALEIYSRIDKDERR